MTMKEYSAFSKALVLVEPHHQIALCHIQDIRWGGGESYLSAEMLSEYSIASTEFEVACWSFVSIGTISTFETFNTNNFFGLIALVPMNL